MNDRIVSSLQKFPKKDTKFKNLKNKEPEINGIDSCHILE